jgi:hypothetical protein
LTSLTLGPLALPLPHVLLYLGFFGALLAGWLAGRKRGANPEGALFAMLLGGLLVRGWPSSRATSNSTRRLR